MKQSIPPHHIELETVKIEQDTWFRISNVDKMRPFFMSIVSDSNHWLFLSSNGGLTAGRTNNQYSLFPYYTDDKITESIDSTGCKTIFRVKQSGTVLVWEPFSKNTSNSSAISRNLYKNVLGNKVIFEEIHHELQLTYRYQWNSSNIFGFVRKVTLTNNSDKTIDVDVLDGFQNVLPYGVEPELQANSSNLVDAYKRTELVPDAHLGLFTLSAIITDKAEPSEALKANIVWARGLEKPVFLLSSLQLDLFRQGNEVNGETDIKGERGALLAVSKMSLSAGESHNWKFIANVNQNHSQVVGLVHKIKTNNDIDEIIEKDITEGCKRLMKLVTSADGLRLSRDQLMDARHFSNVLFNIMRGGIFDDHYRIEKHDFESYLKKANISVYDKYKDIINALAEIIDIHDVYTLSEATDDPDFYRLCKEYLPLKFSRRHGDPSRPWNRFSINTVNELDGSKVLDYEGNWRDIFQNWEALVHSYPDFIESMIFKFVNNSTFDGYNPYRITKGGFDWEIIDPDDPWSHIGYWGDHQLIYLLKFLEFYGKYDPTNFRRLFQKECFVYANVPYTIKPYDLIVKNPKETISFDKKADTQIRNQISKIGSDGALLRNQLNTIHRVSFVEKILASVMAKISNLIPDAGIWMNTQRPEWNDANNALVGNGASMVTLYYLRRYLKFLSEQIGQSPEFVSNISEEFHEYFNETLDVLVRHKSTMLNHADEKFRKTLTDSLGKVASDYRIKIYDNRFSGKKAPLNSSKIRELAEVTLVYLDESIRKNERTDRLFHTYNLIHIDDSRITIEHLSEMLEGQVALLSSGYLDSKQTKELLEVMSSSSLYRPDQHSYLLYPNRELPRFLDKNIIPESALTQSPLLMKLAGDGDKNIIQKDVNGQYHFNGNFRNASILKQALLKLKETTYSELVDANLDPILALYEEVFNHKAFTGRSGTFYAYEGLGSIYWHMVSKLHLAVQEVILNETDTENMTHDMTKLISMFHEIGEGIGVHKSPEVYGAFPTDPYSHTPAHRGAQQPGMTGQVKEDILVHWGELGVVLENKCIRFNPTLIRKSELTDKSHSIDFIAVNEDVRRIDVPRNAFFFSYCQVPVVYVYGDIENIVVMFNNETSKTIEGTMLNTEISESITMRTDKVKQIIVNLLNERIQL